MTDTGRSTRRGPRRLAGAIGGAVALAVVVPVAAAAIGVDVPDPVSAVRTSAGRRTAPAGCVDPCASTSPSPGASSTPAATPDAAPGAAGTHGRIVSTVAACAPRGKDPLFAVTGDLTTHGDFVSAAAAGDTLALPFGSYDLATLGGAESLCSALEAQRAALPSASPTERARSKRGEQSPSARAERTREPKASRSPSPRAERSREADDSESPRPDRAKPSRSPKGSRSS